MRAVVPWRNRNCNVGGSRPNPPRDGTRIHEKSHHLSRIHRSVKRIAHKLKQTTIFEEILSLFTGCSKH
eukprot:6018483-Amphidinium_carterae.1